MTTNLVVMKRLIPLCILIAATLLLDSCKKEGCTDPMADNYDPEAVKDDNSCLISYCEGGCPSNEEVVAGFMYSDVTWTADHVYVIKGKVFVEDGVTLTIEAGTVVKFSEGTGTLSSGLIVKRGGKINAIGTPQMPIIFTSVLDNIESGEASGTSLSSADRGLWGGIILCGKAPISDEQSDIWAEVQNLPIESETYYGGNDPNDDSGIMQYVSIRHSGTFLGAAQNYSGLAIAGVGAQTEISNIEIFGGAGDGLKLLGGTVNVENIAVGFQTDNAIEIDKNYAGTVSNFTIVSDGNSINAVKVGGPEGTTYTSGMFNLNHGEIINVGSTLLTCRFEDRAQGVIEEVNFDSKIQLEALYDNSCSTHLESAFTHLTNSSPTLTFVNCEHQGVQVIANCTVSINDQTVVENALINSAAVGCNLNVFDGWSILAALGYF